MNYPWEHSWLEIKCDMSRNNLLSKPKVTSRKSGKGGTSAITSKWTILFLEKKAIENSMHDKYMSCSFGKWVNVHLVQAIYISNIDISSPKYSVHLEARGSYDYITHVAHGMENAMSINGWRKPSFVS